ncbi:hypothetical protein [Deinococcus marmoris]|nr:hypothetical protein [Deinococcus marmoris]
MTRRTVKVTTIDDLKNDWVLTLGYSRCTAVRGTNKEPFDEKMAHPGGQLRGWFEDGHRVQIANKQNLEKLGYGG